MKIDLIKVEDKLKRFFEKDLKIVAHKNPLQDLTNLMIAALEKNLQETNEQVFAPNIFRIFIQDKKIINQDDLKEWKKYVEDIIKEIARDNAFQLAGPIHIQVFYKPKLLKDFEVNASSSSISSGKTTNIFSNDPKAKKPVADIHGYLITADEDYHPIDKAIMNIGRREDNDLVIDNLRVSRVHAQIRQINDKHVIFDLDSTTGTKVNGVKIRQHTLSPGDVIQIADVPIIYGSNMEEAKMGEDKSKTRMLSPKKRIKSKK